MKRAIVLMILPMCAMFLIAQKADASSCSSLIHIGDSTTVPFVRSIKTMYEGYGFTNVRVSAGNGRSTTKSRPPDKMSGVDAVRYWKQKTPVGRCWVIALGTNDAASVSERAYSDRIDQVLRMTAGDRVLWVDVYMTSRSRPGYNKENANAWNSLLKQKNQDVFAWSSVVSKYPEWISSDGVHYTSEGSRWRAAWIAYASSLSFK